MSSTTLRIAAFIALMMGVVPVAGAARLKELVEIEGLRKNPLVGIGLVVGLTGTGDDASSVATRKPLAALLHHLGITVDQTDIKAKNVALVTVTAELPPFARPGMTADVVVSSMGSAKSLQGGTLIATPLRGADGQTYALAQGPLALGGFAADGASGSTTKKNHVTVGRVPTGAMIEKASPGVMPIEELVLMLRTPDFTTAVRIAEAINHVIPGHPAEARNASVVAIAISDAWQKSPAVLIANVEAIEVIPDQRGKIVIDERTGTIVVGRNVTIDPAAIAHGGITVKVTEQKVISQPNALSGPGAQTTVTPDSQVEVAEEPGKLATIDASTTVGEVAAALNALGLKPRDLVSIFQALKAAGALHGELEIM